MKKRIILIAEKAAQASFHSGKLNQRKILNFVSEFKKLPVSQSISYLTFYLKALKRILSKSVLYIESAKPLSAKQRGKIIQEFKKEYLITEVKTKLNPSLLGGVLIKIGNMVYEDTLNSRLTQLKEVIVNG